MISVIVPVYNVSSYVERCINSILSQTYSDLEVIAVNDGSTDDSGDICERLAQSDNRIIVVHKENGGLSSARNAGLDVANGDAIAFVDSDDYVEKTMYEEMIAEMSDPHVAIVNCGIILTESSGNVRNLASEKREVFSKEEALLDFFVRKGTVIPSACNKLFRRNLFENGIRFNTTIDNEDTAIMPRFLDSLKVEEKVVVMNKSFYHYIKRSGSISTSKKFSLRQYRFLDVLKTYRKMCKEKYPQMLPYFFHYEMVTTYEMFLYLTGSVDCQRYMIQGLSLRCRALKAMVKCMRWKEIREEYADEMKVILVKTALGVRLASILFHI